MDFKNRLKGNTAQGLIEALLEDANYRVVPLGIEHAIREVKTLDKKVYKKLDLSNTLKKLPDFFVATPEFDKTWLVEIKYRKTWSEKVRDELEGCLTSQVKLWAPVYVVIFIGEPTRPNDTPASYLGVGKLAIDDDGDLCLVREFVNDDGEYEEVCIPWDQVEWKYFSRFQDVFARVSVRYEENTLINAIKIFKGLAELV